MRGARDAQHRARSWIGSPTPSGRPLPTVELEIRDPFGAPLPDGEEGEIHVRGPMVMPATGAGPEATAEVIGARPVAAHR